MPRPNEGDLRGFSARAGAYAAWRPTYPRSLVDFLARIAPDRAVAWDAGCGSGQLSVRLAARFERVIATDPSRQQIAEAVAHPRVEYRIGGAESSGLGAGSVQLATAAQAAHWFDLDGYYAEVRRVLCARGVVALITYGLLTVDTELDAVIHRFYFETLGPHWAPQRRLVEDGYRSLPFPFDEFETPAVELRADWTLAQLLGYIDTWSAVYALEQAEGRSRLEAFRAELERAWGGGDAHRTVRWPISMRVGRV